MFDCFVGKGVGAGLAQKNVFLKYYSGLKLQVLESSELFTELKNIKFKRFHSHLKLLAYRYFEPLSVVIPI